MQHTSPKNDRAVRRAIVARAATKGRRSDFRRGENHNGGVAPLPTDCITSRPKHKRKCRSPGPGKGCYCPGRSLGAVMFFKTLVSGISDRNCAERPAPNTKRLLACSALGNPALRISVLPFRNAAISRGHKWFWQKPVRWAHHSVN